MNRLYLAAICLSLAGCSGNPPNAGIPVVDKTVTTRWYAVDHGLASELVSAAPSATEQDQQEVGVIYMDIDRLSKPLAVPATTVSPTPPSSPASEAPSQHHGSTGKAATVANTVSVPSVGSEVAAVTAPPRSGLREQQLTMRYAEGDPVAAYELAQLLFSQGRSEPGYVVLEYAVRRKNPQAIALYSKLKAGVHTQTASAVAPHAPVPESL
jgi:hypothetical protein